MNAPPYPEGRWSRPLGEPPGWLLDLIAPLPAATPPRPSAAFPVSGHGRKRGRVAAYVTSALAGEVGREAAIGTGE